ncbi:hypothetical protein M9H77_11684 [Catharanthus roseus]|uniref:Uncharacterized protein n=1 Tax=Catharanthus roseus TaxID=4058 RepID=A0ACC0BFB9_CATRO|nr:hypothetical protein M9H77_11684 [Catharanthus roseus]
MGIIKKGKIFGNLPTNDAFTVHYPAYPSSIERAIETLGGLQSIAKARSSQSNKLELHFRPEDPYSHPAFGELQACNKFLLRISKNRIKDAQDADLQNRPVGTSSADAVTINHQDVYSELTETKQLVGRPGNQFLASHTEAENQVPDEKEHLSADIVARIPEAYHFNGMADYQHVLAVHADVARRKKRNWAEFEKGGLMDVDQEDLMILLPPLFSLKDVPERIVLKPSATNILKRNQEKVVQYRWEMDIEPSLALDFSIKEIPKKVNWDKHIPQGSEQWEWQKTVCELFDEHPIWVKDSLCERLLDKGLGIGSNMLRRLLFRAAYYFSNGPFLRFWIRKGYDPRKDPESRIYQRTDFRVPEPLRSFGEESGCKPRWEELCNFRVFPYKCQTSFQLFELADEYIQEEIRKPPAQATCTCTTGWFSSIVLDTLRLRVAVRFLSVYPKAGAQTFLKSKSSHFEKSKRICMLPEDSKLKGQQAEREVEENQEKEPNDEGDDQEEEDEEDDNKDDNIEENLDAYEALDLDRQGGDFSIQEPSYTDQENISRTYLQDLFGSFRFNGAEQDELREANDSDGEYQIYEQYSDGNYSDDNEY